MPITNWHVIIQATRQGMWSNIAHGSITAYELSFLVGKDADKLDDIDRSFIRAYAGLCPEVPSARAILTEIKVARDILTEINGMPS